MTDNRKRICIDVGGTFTDCIVLDETSGEISKFKSPTTPSDPPQGFINALTKASNHYGQEFDEFLGSIELLIHGTTLATNVILTGTGAECGMLTTENFRDVIEIRRGIKPVDISLYNLFIPPNKPIVPRYRRLGVKERVLYDGRIATPLDEAHAEEQIHKLVEMGVESVAICFLHAYANPAHELKVKEIVERVAPDMYVQTSSKTLPVWREFERFNTTIVGAYVGPAVTRYLANLKGRLIAAGFKGNLLMMLANGLVQTIEQSLERPVYFLNSGPAAAPAAAVYLGELLGHNDLISVDMGGTSFEVGLIRGGEIPTTTESWVADQRVAIKMVDVETVGAGGGSIAHVDSLGLLRVGPESAAADPGPACYGRGEDATVTDADLMLGYIAPDYFLGGEMKLDEERSRLAMKKVGDQLGLDPVETAQAVFTTVNAAMADQIIKVCTKRGHDLRTCSMVVGGGGGPVHAGFIAENLGIPKVVIPSVAALYSAFGMFAMNLGEDYARSYVARTKYADLDAMDALYNEMEAEAFASFDEIGVKHEDVTLARTIDIRYIGQFHEIEVDVDGGKISQQATDKATERFAEKHEALYTFSMPDNDTEILTLRLKATTPNAPFHLNEREIGNKDPSAALKLERQCYFNGKAISTPVYDGVKLLSGNVIPGPAIIEETTTTVVVPESYDCMVDKYDGYLLTQRETVSSGGK